MTGNTESQFEVSGHAYRRAQQRGVTRRALYWTIEYGQPVRAIGGAVRRTLTRQSAKCMIEHGLSPAEVSRCLGTVVVTRDIGPGKMVVMTVRPTEKNGRKRGGKHKPRYGTSRLEGVNTADSSRS